MLVESFPDANYIPDNVPSSLSFGVIPLDSTASSSRQFYKSYYSCTRWSVRKDIIEIIHYYFMETHYDSSFASYRQYCLKLADCLNRMDNFAAHYHVPKS